MNKSILSVLLGVALLPACNRQGAEPVYAGNLQPVTLSMSSDDTRTTLDGKTILWSSSDQLSVFDGAGNRCFTTTGSGEAASFTGDALEADSYSVLYPYDAAATLSAGVIATAIPSAQTATAGGFDPAANLSAALTQKVGEVHSATMKNVGCYLKFHVESEDARIVSLSARALGGEAIAGGISLSFKPSGEPVADAGAETADEVTIAPESGVMQPGTYFLVMRPGVLSSGLRITVTLEDERTRVCDFGGLKSTVRNTVYHITKPIDYPLNGLLTESLGAQNFKDILGGMDVDWDTVSQQLELNVNSSDGRFAKGEQIVFTARAKEDISVPLTMVAFREGLEFESRDIVLTEETQTVYTCSSDAAASWIVRLCPRGDLDKFLTIGAVVAPEEFRTGFYEPADFVTYWENEKAALRASAPQVTLTPVDLPEGETGDYAAWYLEISMPEGNPVRGYLSVPAHASAGTLPIFMFFHGAGVNSPSNRATLDRALKYAKKGNNGVISLDMNAHGYRDDQDQSYYDALNEGALNHYWNRDLTTREEYYFRLMFLRAVRALDYLCTLPEWDGTRVLAYGTSQGGYQSAALAGLDERVRMAFLDVPAGVDTGSPLQDRKAAWPGIYDTAFAHTPERISDILPYFDGANFLRHTTAKLIVEAGLVDMTCPPGCVLAGYNVSPSTDKILYTYPYRNHSASAMPEDKQSYWNSVINWKKSKAVDNYLQ